LSFKQEKWEYPIPWWNINYYNSDSSYSHDQNWAYGVHGFITSNIIPKKYLNYLPLDPRTNQFYAYWKTIDNNNFEISWIIQLEWDYITKVQWNYNWEQMVWLIREYNWPQFLYDNSMLNFPYNPEELKMTAKIASYSGTVTINWKTENILDQILTENTTIKTENNSNAVIFYSDGSRSTLEENSELILKSLAYPKQDKEHNLVTKILLSLKNGTIWTKASRLNNWSEFQISTQDATAAVRWTIFWVQVKNWQTNISLKIWNLDILDLNWNLIETLEVINWDSTKSISIKNWVKQASSIDIPYNEIKKVFPSNLRLKIESIKENSWKQINIVNTFSEGKLYVNYNAFNCNKNWNKLECNVWTIPNQAKIKFCDNISPLNEKSCTKIIKTWNITYNKIQNKNISLSYTENKIKDVEKLCNWTFSPGCILNIWSKKYKLLNEFSWNGNSGCPTNIITSSTNRFWYKCWQGNCDINWENCSIGAWRLAHWWKKDEKYCENIIWFDWLDVIIAREKTKKRRLPFRWRTYSTYKCNWFENYNWTWYSYEEIN
jgi:hypothetical protein